MMKKSSRLLIVGGEDSRLRLSFARALAEAGWEVCFVTPAEEPELLRSEFEVYHYVLNRELAPFRDFLTLLQLFKLFSRLRPQVVQSFDTKPSIYSPLAAWAARVPRRVRTLTGLGRVYGEGGPRLILRFYETLQRLASAASHTTVFQNQDDRALFIERGLVTEKKARVFFGSGLDIAAWTLMRRGIDRERVRQRMGWTNNFVLLFVARMIWSKGVGVLLQAVQHFGDEPSKLKLVLAGPIDENDSDAVPRAELEQAGDIVDYIGSTPDLGPIYAAADAFVLPTYYREGVPRALMEAGIMGLPLIATDAPGCRKVVVPGKGGFLVKPKSVESLAQAIEALLTSTEAERSCMAMFNQRHIAEHFDLKKIVDQYIDLYRSS
jgi:glycosyltransferase involved in cell wall biosynthesis